MGRKLHYQPGSFYRTDDRTGFPQRAERTRKEWNGLIVDEARWEPRQPQDLVRGVPDRQSVPEPRPLAPNVYVGPIYGQLASAASPQAGTVILDSTAGIDAGDEVGIVQTDGSIFNTTTLAIALDGVTLVIGPALPLGAYSGASLVDYRIKGTPVYPHGVWDVSYWDAALWN